MGQPRVRNYTEVYRQVQVTIKHYITLHSITLAGLCCWEMDLLPNEALVLLLLPLALHAVAHLGWGHAQQHTQGQHIRLERFRRCVSYTMVHLLHLPPLLSTYRI